MVKTATEILEDLDKELLKILEDFARDQHKTTGKVSLKLLDMIIKYRGIKIDLFKDKETARDLWHNLIKLSLISPAAYEDALKRIKTTAKELGCGDDIPDIVA